MTGLLVAAVLVAGPRHWPCEFIQDFRAGKLNRGMLDVFGPTDEKHFRPSEPGLLLDLSDSSERYRRNGLSFRTRFLGDFEIILGYERLFLFKEGSVRGLEPGLSIELLTARTAERARERVVFSRIALSEDEQVYQIMTWRERYQGGGAGIAISPPALLRFPAGQGAGGVLRIERVGGKLAFSVRERSRNGYRRLTEVDFSPAGVLSLSFALFSPGGGQAARVVLTDLVVRAEQFTGLVDLESPVRVERGGFGRRELLVALFGLAAIAVVGWLVYQFGREAAEAVSRAAVSLAAGLRGSSAVKAGGVKRAGGRAQGLRRPLKRATVDRPCVPLAAPGRATEVPTADWDEEALRRFERMAEQYVKQNPEAVAYAQPYRFSFRFEGGKLHGPFLVWYELPAERLATLGSSRAEILARLPKRFEGSYRAGLRDGVFRYWDYSGRCHVRRYRAGKLADAGGGKPAGEPG